MIILPFPIFITRFFERRREEPDHDVFVPTEIVAEKYQNRGIQKGEPKTYIIKEDDKKYKVTEYPCGCIFKDRTDSFGFHNHWCSEHAPSSGKWETP